MPVIIPKFEDLFLYLYLMAEIAIHPYTKRQKSRPIPIPQSSKIATHPSRASVPGIAWE